jgi:hypothetical protein
MPLFDWLDRSSDFSNFSMQNLQGLNDMRGGIQEMQDFMDFQTLQSRTPLEEPNQAPRQEGADNGPEKTVHYVQKLANLNVKLFEHHQTLPTRTSSVSYQAPTVDGRMFAMDQTFRLTQHLIDIMHEVLPLIESPKLGVASSSSPSSQKVANATESEDNLTTEHRAIDKGTLHLILSCYNRVLDTYELIFYHLRNCTTSSITPLYPDGTTVRIPPIQMGSYSQPPDTAVAMQMLLVIIMAAQLFDRLQDIMGLEGGENSALPFVNMKSRGNEDRMRKERIRNYLIVEDTIRVCERTKEVSKAIKEARVLLVESIGASK